MLRNAIVFAMAIAFSARDIAAEVTKTIDYSKPWSLLADPYEETQVIETDRHDAEVVRHMTNPFDWFELGKAEFEMKRAFLQLPDLSLDCERFAREREGDYYNFFIFRRCQWEDARNFPNAEESSFGDGVVTIVSNIHIPFFGEVIKPPHLIMVAQNGYITLGRTPSNNRPYPPIRFPMPPFNVITGIASSWRGGRLIVANFRMGYKTLCTRFQFQDMRSYGRRFTSTFQLDICTDGNFTVRIRRARRVRSPQIGLNSGPDPYRFDVLRRRRRASYRRNSAYVMRPNGAWRKK